MQYIPFTLFAYFLNGIALLIDKFLLSSKIVHPLIYVFYISLLSLVMLLFLPFVNVPTLSVFLLASGSTLCWVAGLFMLYSALRAGVVTRVVPVIGALIPILLVTYAAISGAITQSQTFAVLVLIVGIIFLTLFELRGTIHVREMKYEIFSAVFFALSYTLLRFAYVSQGEFLTVFAWSRLVLLPLGLFIIAFPKTRHIIFGSKETPAFIFRSKQGVLFFIGQICGGSGELLLMFSLSLANPALVNSLQGSQYVFLFIAGLFLAKRYPQIFKDRYGKWAVVSKIIGIVCVGVGLYIMAFSAWH